MAATLLLLAALSLSTVHSPHRSFYRGMDPRRESRWRTYALARGRMDGDGAYRPSWTWGRHGRKEAEELARSLLHRGGLVRPGTFDPAWEEDPWDAETVLESERGSSDHGENVQWQRITLTPRGVRAFRFRVFTPAVEWPLYAYHSEDDRWERIQRLRQDLNPSVRRRISNWILDRLPVWFPGRSPPRRSSTPPTWVTAEEAFLSPRQHRALLATGRAIAAAEGHAGPGRLPSFGHKPPSWASVRVTRRSDVLFEDRTLAPDEPEAVVRGGQAHAIAELLELELEGRYRTCNPSAEEVSWIRERHSARSNIPLQEDARHRLFRALDEDR